MQAEQTQRDGNVWFSGFVVFFFFLPSESIDSHRGLTFQSMVGKALRVGCKTSFCQSVCTNSYTLPVEFQQGCSELTIN